MSLFRRKKHNEIYYEPSPTIMKIRGNIGGFREFFSYLEKVIEEGYSGSFLNEFKDKDEYTINRSPVYLNGHELNEVQFDIYSDDDSVFRVGINIRTLPDSIDYNVILDKHNKLVKKYNNLVNDCKESLDITKNLRNDYNAVIGDIKIIVEQINKLKESHEILKNRLAQNEASQENKDNLSEEWKLFYKMLTELYEMIEDIEFDKE